ncbi:hypothetical protein F4677DRAFT_445553 [Hypoxylon crocopeplum]|nr:hypothetical protein F4677DRAFT_445553 [Hypoxylon crocopeplum]
MEKRLEHKEVENKPERSRDSALLQLPPELLLLIWEELPRVNQAVLSQTCRALYVLLSHDSATACFSENIYLEYLATMARDLPGRWVCEACLQTHPINELDTPRTIKHCSCPLGLDRWRRQSYGKAYKLDSRLLTIDHRHIQTALKYTRLKPPNTEDHLQRLLAPHCNRNFITHHYPFNRSSILNVRYSVFPKIVRGRDGNLRFLTLSTFLYHKINRRLTVQSMGQLRICPHLDITLGYRFAPPCALDCLGMSIRILLEDGDFSHISGCCPRCPTDFKVEASEERVLLCVWQDLGPECSPMDLAWRAHVSDYRLLTGGPNIRFRGPCLPHAEGSIRRLYSRGTDL